MNAGCIEAAVMSGLEAANALLGRGRFHRIRGFYAALSGLAPFPVGRHVLAVAAVAGVAEHPRPVARQVESAPPRSRAPRRS